jgi:hypothetical protein
VSDRGHVPLRRTRQLSSPSASQAWSNYELCASKVGYEAPARPVEIRDDVSVQIEVLAVPEEDPDARWKCWQNAGFAADYRSIRCK